MDRNKTELSEALVEAIRTNDLTKIEVLLREGADPTVPNREGVLPVVLAIQAESVALLRVFLSFETPLLQYAIELIDTKTLEFLLNHVPPHSPQVLGSLLIDVSHLVEPPCCNAMAKMLVQHAADVNARDIEGRTALMFASVQNKLEVVEVLIEVGADVNATDNDTETVLMWASGAGNAESVQRLLEAGAEVHTQSNMEGTALRWAVKSGSLETVEVLLHYGADIYAPMVLAMTISLNYASILEIFLRNGIQLERKIVEDDNILEWAYRCGHGGIVRLLKDYSRLHLPL